MSGRELIRHKMEQAPHEPGVYLFKDRRGEVIYVGKAIDLRSRLASYFARDLLPKTEQQMEEARDLEWILTANELEALILECSLIKRHRPRYNIILKDDKRFPYLKLTMNEEYPRLVKTRELKEDGARYFGPYTSGWVVRETEDLVSRLFRLRRCKESPLKPRSRPCLDYHIKRCDCPCAGLIDKESYRELAQEAEAFLSGRREELLRELKERMKVSAEQRRYEEAAKLRDRIAAVEALGERQAVAIPFKGALDAVALYEGRENLYAEVIEFREGIVIGRQQYVLESGGEEQSGKAGVLAEFLKRHYYMRENIPREILVESIPEEKELIEAWLERQSDHRVRLAAPERGDKRRLVEMALRNAEEHARRSLLEDRRLESAEGLLELSQTLGLEMEIRSIEGFDISTGGKGRETVGSCVLFVDGRPKKSGYRRFRIKTVKDQTDDFASMREMISRRAEKGDLPDLILIDGGKGQLTTAMEALAVADSSGLTEVISLAKKEEEIYTEYNEEPLRLPRDSAALRLLQRVRDEAHRFAVTYHRLMRDKRLVTSVLEEIPGIGREKKKNLLRYFGSLERIARASAEELAGAPGIGPKLAETIINSIVKNREKKKETP